MKDAFMKIFNAHIKRDGADKLLEWLKTTDFFEAPASTKYHLNRPGGLLEHSLNVYARLRQLYINERKRENIDFVALTDHEEEKIAICGLFHDFCKIGLYRQEPKNQKTYDPEKVGAAHPKSIKHDALGDFVWETVMGYTHEDNLPYGHGEKSVYILSGFIKLSREEAMAIRWHMGFSDDTFRGGSQAVGQAFGMYPLAVMLHMADLAATFMDEKE